jgi:indole-3-glycerol phosphate synthase
VSATRTILDEIVEETEAEVEERREKVPQAALEKRAAAAPAPRGFAAALRGPGLAVIAEMKASSPSAGSIARAYRPDRIARAYEAGGAAAISVVCQGSRFGGHPEHLLQARAASHLPILRKDFVTTEYQLFETRAYGADAVLLIVAALEEERLRELLTLCGRLRLDALVEVHGAREVDVALSVDAEIVGVNHRNLKTLSVDTALTARLRPRIPVGKVLVAESGIRDASDARRMVAAGADAILVGEALMRADDPGQLIHDFAREPREPR